MERAQLLPWFLRYYVIHRDKGTSAPTGFKGRDRSHRKSNFCSSQGKLEDILISLGLSGNRISFWVVFFSSSYYVIINYSPTNHHSVASYFGHGVLIYS